MDDPTLQTQRYVLSHSIFDRYTGSMHVFCVWYKSTLNDTVWCPIVSIARAPLRSRRITFSCLFKLFLKTLVLDTLKQA